jgi:hypothetical protein
MQTNSSFILYVVGGGLPPGIILNKTTGQLTGTPTDYGTWYTRVIAMTTYGSSNTGTLVFQIKQN